MRKGSCSRTTKETSVEVSINLDGGDVSNNTGIAFFDHMLDQIGRHGGFGMDIRAKGDIEVDTHHTIEDVGIALGQAFDEALGDKAGVRRYANAQCPLDEALVEISLDLSGRAYLHYEVPIPGEVIYGNPVYDPQLTEEFLRAFVTAARITLHCTLRRGRNSHHIIEALFKSLARALADAVRVEGDAIPSTKGVL